MAPDLPCVLRQLTAAGRGGVAVLELEGPGAAQALARIGLAPGPAGSLRLVRPASEGEILDEALLCTWAADRIELHLHGSPPLLARLRTLLGDPGEGPLDGEAELEHALAHAPGERAARLVLAQMRGRWSAELARLQTLAPTEAARRIAQLVAAGRRARPYLVPRRVVLQGPVNAGKSTLFNALVGHERVIISDLAGTTRDAVLERIHLGEIPVDLVDTAGWREPGDDAVEARGQALGRDLAERADLVLFLEPPGYDGPRPKGALVVHTMGDLPGASPDAISVERDGAAGLRAWMDRICATLAPELPPGPTDLLPVTAGAWRDLRAAARAAGVEAAHDWPEI